MTFDQGLFRKEEETFVKQKDAYPVELISYKKPKSNLQKYTNLSILRNIIAIYNHKPRCVDPEDSHKETKD